jgi:hypothetical protein
MLASIFALFTVLAPICIELMLPCVWFGIVRIGVGLTPPRYSRPQLPADALHSAAADAVHLGRLEHANAARQRSPDGRFYIGGSPRPAATVTVLGSAACEHVLPICGALSRLHGVGSVIVDELILATAGLPSKRL